MLAGARPVDISRRESPICRLSVYRQSDLDTSEDEKKDGWKSNLCGNRQKTCLAELWRSNLPGLSLNFTYSFFDFSLSSQLCYDFFMFSFCFHFLDRGFGPYLCLAIPIKAPVLNRRLYQSFRIINSRFYNSLRSGWTHARVDERTDEKG